MEGLTFALGMMLRFLLPLGLLFAFSHCLRTWDARRA